MEHPVLVRAYTGQRTTSSKSRGTTIPTLPPISAYAFADIISSADGAEFQSAIDGIAEICAKNRTSLAEEYASHMPPVGEITEATWQRVGPQLRKPGVRRALTSVPEGSSGSSEGSRRSKRRSIFGFRGKEQAKTTDPRMIRIGSMGRSISVSGTTALAHAGDAAASMDIRSSSALGMIPEHSSSIAATSLQKLLGITTQAPD